MLPVLPQLYLNYKLKSVAHLPWRQMTYKFLNTIIDDLFAFVIRMPLLHRISVFRCVCVCACASVRVDCNNTLIASEDTTSNAGDKRRHVCALEEVFVRGAACVYVGCFCVHGCAHCGCGSRGAPRTLLECLT